MGTRNDFEFVQQVVEMVMGYKIFSNNRKRKVVETRMMFSLIMIELNYPLTQIGEFMDRDHTTVIHHRRTMRGLLETDSEVLKKYLRCKEIIISEKQDVNLEVNDNDKLKALALQNQIEMMKSEYQTLKEENKELLSKIQLMDDKRFLNIFKAIKDNTPIGHELIIERKIRKLLDD